MKRLIALLFRLITCNYYFQKKKKNTLLVLMFHQVNDDKRTFYPGVPTAVFDEICAFIQQNYVVLTFSEVKSHFENSDLPAAIISFDDGHFDIIKNAFPILSKYKMKFNVNIDTEILQTGKPQDFVRVYDILNHSDIKQYKDPEYMSHPITINRDQPILTENEFTKILGDLNPQKKRDFTLRMEESLGVSKESYSKMLSDKDLKVLCEYGVELGSHSHTHPIMTNLSLAEKEIELLKSKEILEQIVEDKTVNIFAFPNGVFNDQLINQAQKLGYSIFLKTEDKSNDYSESEKVDNSFFRINQYHQSFNEMLAHTYGVKDILKNILKR